MRSKLRNAFVLVLCALFVIPIGTHAYASDSCLEEVDSFPVYSIIVHPEKFDNQCVWIAGYVNINENGIAIFATKLDYVHNTVENAIWIPKRTDIDWEGCLEQVYAKEGEHISIYLVIQGNEQKPYAASAMMIDQDNPEKDSIFQNSEKQFGKGAPYNRKEESRIPIEVSFYRILGDPWAYDGKKVKVEATFSGSGSSISANQNLVREPGFSIIETQYVNAEFIYDSGSYAEMWNNIAIRYKQFGVGTGKGSPASDLYGAILDGEMHVDITMMFYMYDAAFDKSYYRTWDTGEQWTGYDKVSPCYSIQDISIHQNDLDTLRSFMSEKNGEQYGNR